MIRFLEELSMNAWPSLQTYFYDGWILRVSNGYTKRANSVNLLYNSKINLEKKIEFCKEFYKRIGLPVVYKITSDSKCLIIDEKLNELGYKKEAETSVRTLDLSLFSSHANIETKVLFHPSDEWINGFIHCCQIENSSNKESLSLMLKKIIGQCIFVTHYAKNIAVGYGYGVINNGYIGIYNIHVETAFRGNGYGKAVMNSILYEAKQLGAKKAYLQVVSGNMVAEILYKNLGFNEIYRYWYRKKIESK